MRVGVPKEIKENEFRIGLKPAGNGYSQMPTPSSHRPKSSRQGWINVDRL